MMTIIKNLFKRLLNAIRSLFLNGLLTLLPVVLTTVLFVFFLRVLKGWLAPLHNMVPLVFQQIPGSEIILGVVIIFALGAVLKFLLLHPLVHFFESILQRIPLIRPVYFGIKQLINAFTAQDEISFKQVVLTQFPLEGVYSIGFVTGEPLAGLKPKQEGRFLHIYIPTSPNPTTGYFVIIPEKKIQVIDLTRQEAMALIISGGIIQPDRFIKN